MQPILVYKPFDEVPSPLSNIDHSQPFLGVNSQLCVRVRVKDVSKFCDVGQ